MSGNSIAQKTNPAIILAAGSVSMTWKSLFLTVIILNLGASCAVYQDNSYLTPIPMSTLHAYGETRAVGGKLQPVNEAWLMLPASRLEFRDTPRVILVEELALEEAHQKVGIPRPGEYLFEDRPGSTRVWLVVFEAEARLIPPDPEHTFTPGPFLPGCTYVIVDQEGRRELGSRGCADILE